MLHRCGPATKIQNFRTTEECKKKLFIISIQGSVVDCIGRKIS